MKKILNILLILFLIAADVTDQEELTISSAIKKTLENNLAIEVSKNFNIIGQMYYSFSTIACVPASKSQKGGLALGAQAGLKKLTNVLNNGGFSQVKMTYKTASNMVIEARV